MAFDSLSLVMAPGFRAMKNSPKVSNGSSCSSILGTRFMMILYVDTDLLSSMKCVTNILDVVTLSSWKHLRRVLCPYKSRHDSPFYRSQSVSTSESPSEDFLSNCFRKLTIKLSLWCRVGSNLTSLAITSALFMKKSARLYPLSISSGMKNSKVCPSTQSR